MPIPHSSFVIQSSATSRNQRPPPNIPPLAFTPHNFVLPRSTFAPKPHFRSPRFSGNQTHARHIVGSPMSDLGQNCSAQNMPSTSANPAENRSCPVGSPRRSRVLSLRACFHSAPCGQNLPAEPTTDKMATHPEKGTGSLLARSCSAKQSPRQGAYPLFRFTSQY